MDVTKTCRDLGELLPEVRKGAEVLLAECKRQGLDIIITETYRSQERQDYLFEQGRTRPGRKVTWTRNSFHTTRRAFDVCQNIKGDEYNPVALMKVAHLAKMMGFNPGAFWKKQDIPHIQLNVGDKLNLNVFEEKNKALEEKKRETEEKKEGEYMKEKVKLKHEEMSAEVEAINEAGHRYIKVQDLWKIGFKVSGNDKEIVIEKGEA